MCLTCYKLN